MTLLKLLDCRRVEYLDFLGTFNVRTYELSTSLLYPIRVETGPVMIEHEDLARNYLAWCSDTTDSNIIQLRPVFPRHDVYSVGFNSIKLFLNGSDITDYIDTFRFMEYGARLDLHDSLPIGSPPYEFVWACRGREFVYKDVKLKIEDNAILLQLYVVPLGGKYGTI